MKSIRRCLTRNLLLALMTLLGLGFTAIYILVWNELVDAFDSSLRAKALAIASLGEVERGRVYFEFSDDFLRSYMAKKPRNYYQLVDGSGKVLQRSASLGETLLSSNQPLRDADHPRYWNLTLPNGRPVRATGFIYTPKVDPSETIESNLYHLSLVVAADRGELNELLGGLLAAVMGCGGLLAGAVWLIVPRVLRRELGPLNQLGMQAAQIDAKSLSIRFDTQDLPAELQPIAQRLNDLLKRLEESFGRERRFSADLAHELRTPLAELRSLAECAIKWPDERDPETDHETLAVAQHMERIVGHILALVRGEEGQRAIVLELVAIDKLILEIWPVFAPRAEGKKIKVTQTLQPIQASADSALLRSVLTNLCDNAVDYTPAEGQIDFAAYTSGGRAVVTVSNPTRGLESDDVTKLFDRFWRKDSARSDSGHVGLGLSLALAFTQSMTWNLSAELDPQGRIIFTLQGPIECEIGARPTLAE